MHRINKGQRLILSIKNTVNQNTCSRPTKSGTPGKLPSLLNPTLWESVENRVGCFAPNLSSIVLQHSKSHLLIDGFTVG